MTHDFERTSLWKSSLAKLAGADEHEVARDRLRGAYLKFRDRVSHLVSTIKSELPGLTVHDITHLDALWRVASEIAGPTYELTPAEAFVLGGAILLHDSAHAIAAFPGGKAEIKQTQHWRDLIAQRYKRQEPAGGSDDERAALFQVLRHLHATQAAKLPFVKWSVPGDNTPNFLIEDAELRNYYGELIGQIAESHHWPAHRVATEFSHQNHTPPSYLPTEWTVDAMKVAFLLRTADAAHIDDGRAPWFLFALQKPQGISAQHWRFQSKLGQVKCNKHGELQISATPTFSPDERESWWLAYDTAQMIDRELRDAHGHMRDHGREVFRAFSVLGAGAAESFARYVKPNGWEPIDVAPKIGNVNKIIEMLGGKELYGDRPDLALRELLQNAIDAIHAKRALGGLGSDEGEIVVALDLVGKNVYRLSVSDNGVGMSKYVLTSVLLDFGNSLWKSDALRDQLPGLAATKFESAGQFGIGFYSIFMLGDVVEVSSLAFAITADNHALDCHTLRFEDGLRHPPTLTKSSVSMNGGSGTKVSVTGGISLMTTLLQSAVDWRAGGLHYGSAELAAVPAVRAVALAELITYMVPASDIQLISSANGERIVASRANDWHSLSDDDLLRRIREPLRTQLWKVPLHGVYDENGLCLGRVGIPIGGTRTSLVLTQQGIVLERTNVLVGLLHAQGPHTAARTKAEAANATIASWQRWANEVRNELLRRSDNIEALSLLSHLANDADFPIYERRQSKLSLSKLLLELVSEHSVVVHTGEVESSPYDSMLMNTYAFNARFSLIDGIVIAPQSLELPHAWRSLGLTRIDFAARLGRAMRRIWPDMIEVLFCRKVVGTVDGVDIVRDVVKLSRSPSAD
jgi:hypothetical protein